MKDPPRVFRDAGDSVRRSVIGRRAEIEAIGAALAAGRDLLLEGPPGTSKSTLLRAVAEASGAPLFFVEGNADLTPAKLVGHHDPARVVKRGYRGEDFVFGPLLLAMREGGLLYVEEFNRVPEDTLNVLLGPLAERSLSVPRVGEVEASPGFRVVAAMNPFDDAGTSRLSRSVRDRFCRLSVGYQPEGEEREIVALRTGGEHRWLVEGAVSLVRGSRSHPEVSMGSSVRGAIDLVLVAGRLAGLRGVSLAAGSVREASNAAKDAALDAALVALSGRISPDETTARTPEEILHELWEDVFHFVPRRARGGRSLGVESAVSAPPGRARRRRRRGPVTAAPKRLVEREEYPKPGKAREEPRTFLPNEMSLLASERGAGALPGKVEDIRRENPRARNVLSEEGDLDPEAFRGLYERDEEAAVSLLGDLWLNAPDEELRELTRKIALKVVVRHARKSPARSPGRGKLRPVRYHFDSDDLDLDRTLEEISGKPYPEYDDFWVNERVRTKKAYVLLLDVSGSMRGEKLVHVALAAGSLARSLGEDDHSVVLFWRDAAVVKAMTQRRPSAELLDDILSARARGLTNLRHGLEVGLRELERAPAREREAIIFTDGMHNLGEDPLPLVARYPKLHVIGTSPEDSRVRACRDLAARGGGRCVFVEHMEDIPAAVSHCLSGG